MKYQNGQPLLGLVPAGVLDRHSQTNFQTSGYSTVDNINGAARYERTDQRATQSTGFRERAFGRWLGALDLNEILSKQKLSLKAKNNNYFQYYH